PGYEPRPPAEWHRNMSPASRNNARRRHERSGTAIPRLPKPITRKTRCESGHSGPTDSSPTLRCPRCLLHATNRPFYKVPHERHLVAVILQGLRALDRQLSGHVGGRFVAGLAGNRVFHLLETYRMRGHAVDRDADAVNPIAGKLRRGCDVDQREIPHISIADFFEIELRAPPRRRNADRRQQVARLQYRHSRDVGT